MNPVYNMELIRKRKGITKTHIAKYCNHSVTWYADIAKGRRRLRTDDAIKIAAALGEDVKVFFDQQLSDTLTTSDMRDTNFIMSKADKTNPN